MSTWIVPAVGPSSMFEDFAMVVIKVLAAIGGAAVGGLLAGLLTQLLCQACFHRKVPRSILLVLRGLGAIALGVAVWMILDLGLGGSGSLFRFGGKGGPGSGTGVSNPDTGPSTLITQRSTTRTTPPRSVAMDTVAVEMLGGERYAGDERFYLLDEKRPALTLPELVDALKKRRAKEPNLQSVEIVIYDKGSVARDHSAVQKLEEAVQSIGLNVKLTPLSGASPASSS